MRRQIADIAALLYHFSGQELLRYALYFTPPKNDPLTGAASIWLGRDAFAGETYPAPEEDGMTAAEQFELTADPRRYGFHAHYQGAFCACLLRSTERDN